MMRIEITERADKWGGWMTDGERYATAADALNAVLAASRRRAEASPDDKDIVSIEWTTVSRVGAMVVKAIATK